MARIGVQRDTLAKMLRSRGEDDLAERAVSLTDDELTRIGTLGAYYAWSEDALAFDGRGSTGGARALSLATIDVLEGAGRDMRRHRTDAELAWGWSEGTCPSALEIGSFDVMPRRGSCPALPAERMTNQKRGTAEGDLGAPFVRTWDGLSR